jgi:hypothetical protein
MHAYISSRRQGERVPARPLESPPLNAARTEPGRPGRRCDRRLLVSWPFIEMSTLVTSVGEHAHDTRYVSRYDESDREGGGAPHQELSGCACDAPGTGAAAQGEG